MDAFANWLFTLIFLPLTLIFLIQNFSFEFVDNKAYCSVEKYNKFCCPVLFSFSSLGSRIMAGLFFPFDEASWNL